jgi:LacI family fructose operon transcriptional repressor
MIAGASDPGAIAGACRDAHLPHVFVDHACADAPSVVSDNFAGAASLTRRLLAGMPPADPADPATWLYFLGGEARLPASSERIRGFRHEARASGALFDESQIAACGYDSARAEAELRRLCDRLGRLPAGLFVNSIDCFEGVVRFLGGLSEADIAACDFGCFDYDPFGLLLRFPLRMVRQRADLIVAEAFRQLDAGHGGPELVQIAPDQL